MVNGIIAPWLLVSGTGNNVGWATYSNTDGLAFPNTNGTANYRRHWRRRHGQCQLDRRFHGQLPGQTLNSLAVLNPGAAVYHRHERPVGPVGLAFGWYS